MNTPTKRLSIDVTPEQHTLIKAFAASKGQSIKDYIIERVVPEHEFSIGEHNRAVLRDMREMAHKNPPFTLKEFMKWKNEGRR